MAHHGSGQAMQLLHGVHAAGAHGASTPVACQRHRTDAFPPTFLALEALHAGEAAVPKRGTGMLPGHQNRGTSGLGPRYGLYATPDAPMRAGTGCVDGAETAPRERDHARGTPLGREGSKGCAGGRELPRPGPGADPPAGPGAGPPSKAHAVLERPRGPRLGGAAGSSCAGRVQKRPRIDGAKFQGWPNSRDGLVNEGR